MKNLDAVENNYKGDDKKVLELMKKTESMSNEMEEIMSTIEKEDLENEKDKKQPRKRITPKKIVRIKNNKIVATTKNGEDYDASKEFLKYQNTEGKAGQAKKIAKKTVENLLKKGIENSSLRKEKSPHSKQTTKAPQQNGEITPALAETEEVKINNKLTVEEKNRAEAVSFEELSDNTGYEAGSVVEFTDSGIQRLNETQGEEPITTPVVEKPEETVEDKNNKDAEDITKEKTADNLEKIDFTHKDIVNARMEAVKQRLAELVEIAKGSYNVDMVREENEELRKEEVSLHEEIKKIEEQEERDRLKKEEEARIKKEKEENERIRKEEELRIRKILKEQFVKKERSAARLQAVRERLAELAEIAKGSHNIDMVREENEELRKEEASLLKEIDGIMSKFPELEKMGEEDFNTVEEESSERSEEGGTSNATETVTPESKNREEQPGKTEEETGARKIEAWNNLEGSRFEYIYEYKKWKKESDKQILIDKTRNVVFNILAGASNVFSKKSKEKIDYKKAVDKNDYVSEKVEKSKDKYTLARTEMAKAMYEEKKAKLEKENLEKEAAKKELEIYRAKEVLKMVTDEFQKIIDAKEKPKAWEKIMDKFNSIKPKWKRVAFCTVLFLPLSATSAMGASAIATVGIPVGIASLAAVRFGASMGIGLVVGQAARTIDWAKKGSDLKFVEKKYFEKSEAKIKFAKTGGEIDSEQIEEYEKEMERIRLEEKKRAQNRKISKYVVGGAIALIAGYVAYDAMGHGVSHLKEAHTAAAMTGDNAMIKPDTASHITKPSGVTDNDVGDIEDVTARDSVPTNPVAKVVEQQHASPDSSNLSSNVNPKVETPVQNNIEVNKTPDISTGGYHHGVLEQIDQTYNQNIKHLFPNNATDHAWDNVSSKNPSDIFKLEKEGGLSDTYKPLAAYLHKIEQTTGLTPENSGDQTIADYMNRGLEKAHEVGKMKDVELFDHPKVEAVVTPPSITPEEIFKITGAKGLNVANIKDFESIIKGYEADGFKEIPGQVPIEMRLGGIELKDLHTVSIEDTGMTKAAVQMASNAKMNNVMELVHGKSFYDYYLEKSTSGGGVKLLHIKFWK